MCGRFLMLGEDEVRTVAQALGRGASGRMPLEGRNRVEAFPGSVVPVARLRGNALEIDELIWGFPTTKGTSLVFNARIESALSGAPMWQDALRNGRCIVPTTAFFEPHATEKALSPRTGKPVKRPYVFRSPDGGPLLMAGVSDEGRCSVVTCEPNGWVSPVHARMPLVLRFEEVDDWLHGSPARLAALADRSDMALDVGPELAPAPTPQRKSAPDQLSLF